jgi:solute carrier family 25 citrate transporter 1
MPTRRYKGGIHALHIIIREHGVNEVYRGLVSTTIKQSATSAVRMGTYNSLKETVSPRLGGLSNHPIATFGLGAIAGMITVFATQPFDTIKTRTQGATGITVSAAVRDIFRDGGVKSFWSGSSMRLGRLVLSGGIVFTVYENVSSAMSSGTLDRLCKGEKY